MRSYPCLTINKSKIVENASNILSRCRDQNIDVCGIVKGCNGMIEVARIMKECGCTQLGSSRLEQIRNMRDAGIPGPYLLIRIAAPSEVEDVVSLCEYSLQSEGGTIELIEKACAAQNRTHNVIIMADLGDLREGLWDMQEFVDVCSHIEKDLPHVHLAGIGVNLGCIGSVKPTKEKMSSLLSLRDLVEKAIHRKLEIISGGNTFAYPLIQDHQMPQGINHMRIGENIILASDLQRIWGRTDLSYLHKDTFTLKAEIIELKTKPSFPSGEIMRDAFGYKPHFDDKGMRRRAILALGRADVGDPQELIPVDSKITIEGSSSDHIVIDVTDCSNNYQVGDVVEFQLFYQHILFATEREDIRVEFVE